MILVDRRTGSAEFAQPLRDMGVGVEVTTLAAADFEITGQGPDGRPVLIGVERKTISEIISCISGDDRFIGEQLPRLASSYEERYLVVEGLWRADDNGKLMTMYRGQWVTMDRPYCALAKFLMKVETRARVSVWRTARASETALWLKSLHARWTGKAWEDWGIDGVYQAPLEGQQWSEPPLRRRWAADLPGIGSKLSIEVSRAFRSARQLANADEKAWQEIPGIGKKRAAEIVAEITKEK